MSVTYFSASSPRLRLARGIRFSDGLYVAQTEEEINFIEHTASFKDFKIVRVEPEVAAQITPAEMVSPDSVFVRYGKMSKAALKDEAVQRGLIDLADNFSKPELVAMLLENDNPAPEPLPEERAEGVTLV